MLSRPFPVLPVLIALVGLFLAGCDADEQDSPVRISIIGQSDELITPMQNLGTTAGQMMLAATAQGLVVYDVAGDVVPGLAQRWIVMDDGKSYIFRLRHARWTNGKRVDARDVQRLLQARMRDEARRDPYGPAAMVTDIVAMTGDVIEIRLHMPQPDFLLLLARPTMAVVSGNEGSGPYSAIQSQKDAVFSLTPMLSPAEETDNEEDVRPHEKRLIRAERASRAVARFRQEDVDWVAGGTLADMPYPGFAEVNPRLVHFDPVQGLFGLALAPDRPILEDRAIRQALSMAIDREAVVTRFDVNRWKIAENIIPHIYDLPHAPTAPEWSGRSMAERRAFAAGVITRWRAQNDGEPVNLSISLPGGPGGRLLFLALQAQFRAIGISLNRVEHGGDLMLIDEVAPYNSAAWYLGRISCARKVQCDPQAEELLKQSVETGDAAKRMEILGEAERLMQRHGGFIPLAMPVRWSLVSARLNGYRPSVRGIHGLRGLIE